MGDHTHIEWTDATVNFWWGCTKVGPGCDNCYAEKLDARFGPSHWGVGAERRKIKGAVKLLQRLDNDYSLWAAADHGHVRRRVFISSMADMFDLEVPVEWFAEAWGAILAADRLDIQIVTKRVSAVEKRLAAIGVAARWIQRPPKASWVHFDICRSKRAAAIKLGAIETDRFGPSEFVARLRGDERRLQLIADARARRAA